MSMSLEIIKCYLRLPTAYEIWNALSKAFYNGDDELQVFFLNQKAFTAKQRGKTLFVYYGESTKSFQELDRCDTVVIKDLDDVQVYRKSIERLRVHIFLAGLEEDFDQIRREILQSETVPNLEECYSLVQRETRHCTTLKCESETSEASTMVV